MATPIDPKKALRRQGDILFRPVSVIPQFAEKMEGNIVAHGESGNLHQTEGGLVQLFRKKNDPTDLFSPRQQNEDPLQVDYLEVHQDTVLVHEEHNTIPIPAGKYAVVHEREYDPFQEEGQKIRQVID